MINDANLPERYRQERQKQTVSTDTKASAALRGVRKAKRLGCKADCRPGLDVQRHQQRRFVRSLENYIEARMEVKRHLSQINKICCEIGFRDCDKARWKKPANSIRSFILPYRRVQRKDRCKTYEYRTQHLEEEMKTVPAMWANVTRYVGQLLKTTRYVGQGICLKQPDYPLFGSICTRYVYRFLDIYQVV